MAKRNVRDAPLAGPPSDGEQLSDIVFVLDKKELRLEGVSEVKKDG